MGKRIIFTSNSTWAIYNFRKDLIIALKHEGYEIVIVSPFDECSKKLIKLGIDYRNIELERSGINPIREIKLLLALYSLYKEINPYTVFHYSIKPNIYGTLAARFCKINSVCVVSGLGYVFINHNFLSLIARLLYKISLALSYRVWFLNDDDRRFFVEEGVVLSGKTEILPGEGVDTAYFSPDYLINVEEQYNFVLIGRILIDKGVYEFIEAARRLKRESGYEVKFALVGPIDRNPSSISKSQIDQWTEEGVVDYLGQINDIRNVIASSGCVVLPSYREGISRTLLEASSMSKPVITTDVSGCRDVVDHNKTGLLCRPKNADDLFDAMKTLMYMSPERKKEMGSAGREKIIDNFSNDIVINKYVDFLRNNKL